MNKLEYIKDISTGIETISYENVNISYPEHTHIGHLVFGIVTEGKVGVKIDQEEFVCNEGEMFSIALNMKHSIYPISSLFMILDLDIHIIMEKIIKSYGLCLKIDVKRTNDTGNVKKNLISYLEVGKRD